MYRIVTGAYKQAINTSRERLYEEYAGSIKAPSRNPHLALLSSQLITYSMGNQYKSEQVIQKVKRDIKGKLSPNPAFEQLDAIEYGLMNDWLYIRLELGETSVVRTEKIIIDQAIQNIDPNFAPNITNTTIPIAKLLNPELALPAVDIVSTQISTLTRDDTIELSAPISSLRTGA